MISRKNNFRIATRQFSVFALYIHYIIDRPSWRSFSSLNRRGKDPDFFNAKLRINGTLWVGNVSVMENASDWYLYGMDKDKSYDNVILAVVGNADTDIRTQQGERGIL